MGTRGGARPGAGRPPKQPGQKRMVLSTTISQRCWTDVHLFASSHGKSVSEVVEALLVLGTGLSPYKEFYQDWYAARTPEETFEQVLAGREKVVPREPSSLDPARS